MKDEEQDDNYGFTLIDFTNIDKIKSEASIQAENANSYWRNLQQVRNLVVPLLTNLAKTPEKDIHWPNRDVKLNELIDKINRLCNDTRRK